MPDQGSDAILLMRDVQKHYGASASDRRSHHHGWRSGRAFAIDPRIVILEHPTAALSPEDADDYLQDIVRAADARRLAVVALTADKSFARGLGGPVLVQRPATGRLEHVSRWHWR